MINNLLDYNIAIYNSEKLIPTVTHFNYYYNTEQ